MQPNIIVYVLAGVGMGAVFIVLSDVLFPKRKRVIQVGSEPSPMTAASPSPSEKRGKREGGGGRKGRGTPAAITAGDYNVLVVSERNSHGDNVMRMAQFGAVIAFTAIAVYSR